MTLNDIMAVILGYFADMGTFGANNYITVVGVKLTLFATTNIVQTL